MNENIERVLNYYIIFIVALKICIIIIIIIIIINEWKYRERQTDRHRQTDRQTRTQIKLYISGWIFQKVLAEIVQKDLILSQKALISNRRNLGLFAPTSMRFPSKDNKSKDLSF